MTLLAHMGHSYGKFGASVITPVLRKPNFKIRHRQYWLYTRASNANITHLEDPKLRRKNLHIQIVFFLHYIWGYFASRMYAVFLVNSECDDALWEESRKMMHDNKDDDEIEDKQGESKKKGMSVREK